MARTRVVLAALPAMLADIVRGTLARHPDLEIVGDVGDRAALLPLIQATAATVALVGLEAEESPEGCLALLRACPALLVLAIDPDGRRAYRCEMRMQVSVLTELSADLLLAGLRATGDVDPALHPFSPLRSISLPPRPSDNESRFMSTEGA